MRGRVLPLPTLLARWVYGMGMVSWRYLWMTTPLHRTVRRSGTPDGPPELAEGVDRDGLQPAEVGVGPLFRRRFRVRVRDARLDAEALMGWMRSDMEHFVPREVVRVHGAGHDGPLRVNDELVVDMPGPWNGPVRVVSTGPTHLRLATLEGHLEAGQIEFRARDEDGHLTFEIEAWARPGSALVHLLYSRLRLAKEIQLNMWVRFCRAAARAAGGRPSHGIEIETVEGPAS